MRIYIAGCAIVAAFALTQTTAQAKATIDQTDKKFINDTAQAGLTEVKLGELAQKKGTTASVQDFGKQMVADHTKANDSLKEVALKKGVTPPAKLNDMHHDLVQQLAAEKGRAFDRKYIRQMVADHTKVVEALKAQKDGSGDTELKTWAANTLPTVEHHLQMAIDLEKTISTKTR